MGIKKIREKNSQQFLDDLKGVKDVMVLAFDSKVLLHVTKKEILREAETEEIHYYITDKIFVRRRNVMVII